MVKTKPGVVASRGITALFGSDARIDVMHEPDGDPELDWIASVDIACSQRRDEFRLLLGCEIPCGSGQTEAAALRDLDTIIAGELKHQINAARNMERRCRRALRGAGPKAPKGSAQ
jgi:hypothetical protein